MSRLNCLEVEPLLAEYVERAAGAPASAVEEHLASCAACRAAVEEMRLALSWARAAEEVPVPAALLTRILAQTGGQPETALSGWRGHLRGWFRPVLEPRFAMGMAMAVISCSLLLKTAGVDLRRVSLADLDPARLYFNLDRRAHLAGSRAVKFYRDLRIVYEIQTQLQALREESTAPAPEEKAAPPAEEKQKKEEAPRPEGQKQQNRKWSREMSMAAAVIL